MLLRFKKLSATLVGFAYSGCMSSTALAGFAGPSVLDIPALDEYGLIALAGVLAVAGGITLARRNKKK